MKSKLRKYILRFVFAWCLISVLYQTNWFYNSVRSFLGPSSAAMSSIESFGNSLDVIGGVQTFFNPIEENQKLKIVLSEANKINLKGYASDENHPIKKWLPIKININNDTLLASIKLHGRHWNHYRDGKNSFSLRFDQKTDSIKYKRYKLIKAEEFDLNILAINNYAHSIGLIAPKGKMVELYINGQSNGTYYFAPDYKSDYLTEFFGHAQHSILQNVKRGSEKAQGYSSEHLSDLDVDSSNLKIQKKDPLFMEAKLAYGELLKDTDFNSFSTHFNLEYISKFLALTTILNDVHFISGDNLKLIYNHKDQKFYPIFRIESKGFLMKDSIGFNEQLFNSNPIFSNAKNHIYFKRLLKDERILGLRNEFLKGFTIDKLSAGIVEEIDDNRNIIDQLSGSRRRETSKVESLNYLIENNYQFVANYLSVK